MNTELSSILIKALDATQSPVTVTDALAGDDIIIYCNKAFVQLSGYEEDEIIGRNCRFLQGDDTDKRTVGKISEAIKVGKDIDITLLNYRKNGESFWNDLHITPVKNDEGKVTHHFGFQNDISMRLEKDKISKLVKDIEADIIMEEYYTQRIEDLKNTITLAVTMLDGKTDLSAIKKLLNEALKSEN